MMLSYIGWNEAANALLRGLQAALAAHQVTADLAALIPGASALSTSDYADALIAHILS